MKANRAIIHYSLFAALVGLMPTGADAALRVGNHSRSYAEAYQQVNALRNSAARLKHLLLQRRQRILKIIYPSALRMKTWRSKLRPVRQTRPLRLTSWNSVL